MCACVRVHTHTLPLWGGFPKGVVCYAWRLVFDFFFGSFFFVLIPAGAACMFPSVAVLPVEVAGCRGVECMPAATLQGCGGLSLSHIILFGKVYNMPVVQIPMGS